MWKFFRVDVAPVDFQYARASLAETRRLRRLGNEQDFRAAQDLLERVIEDYDPERDREARLVFTRHQSCRTRHRHQKCRGRTTPQIEPETTMKTMLRFIGCRNKSPMAAIRTEYRRYSGHLE